MKKLTPHLLLTAFVVFGLLFWTGCKNSSSDTSVGGGESGESSEPSGGTGNFNTECGTVIGDSTQNPASAGDGVAVTIVRAAGPASAIISRGGGQQLVKLRALSNDVSSFLSSRAIDIINGFSGSAVLFTDECPTTLPGGGVGVVGELFSANGRSLTEALITGAATEISSGGSCGESLVAGCYQSLRDASGPETGANISNFLWKPRSERDGNLVILFNPGGATVVVNGVTLSNSGASNGRGTTARTNRPGGAFGSNATVEAFDSRGRVLLFPGGATSLNIPNGSSRLEF